MISNNIARVVAAFLSLQLALQGQCRAQDADASQVHDDSVNPWWEDSPWIHDERGFHFYPPEKVPKPKAKTKIEQVVPPVAAASAPLRVTEIKDAQVLRAEVDRLKRVAIMDPSPANMYAYLDANKYIQDKAAMFTDMWRRVVWQNSELDYNVKNPTANFAQVEMKQQRTLQRESQVKDLAKSNGLLFFYRGDCAYCKMQAPILHMIKRQYGFNVLAVSLDGGGLNEFPGARVDNGISKVVSGGEGVTMVPALYMVSDSTKRVVPIGAGVMAMDDIIERIRVLVNTRPGSEF